MEEQPPPQPQLQSPSATPGGPGVALDGPSFRVDQPRVVLDRVGDEVVQYELVFCPRGRRMYSRWFSWSELKDVHEAIAKRLKKIKMPSFASRAWFRSETDPDFMEARRKELHAYWQELVAVVPLDDVDLEAFLARAELCAPVASFAVPALATYGLAMIPVSCLLGPDDEVFLGPVVDTLLDAIKGVARVRMAFDMLDGSVERELALLDQVRDKLGTAADAVKSNVPCVRGVLAAPAAPGDLKEYLHDLLTVALEAADWATHVEQRVLESLCLEPAPVSSPLLSADVASAAEPVVDDIKGTLDELRARAEKLAVDALSAAYSNHDFSALMANKKALIATLLRRREQHLQKGEEASAAQCGSIVTFLEENVVPIKSMADSIRQFEARLYALVDARGAVRDAAGATALRRELVAYRRMLKDVKAGWLQMEQHDAVRADVDRLTDLQENASSLQLNVEQSFASHLAPDVDSVVHSQMRKKALSEAEADHKRTEDLFEL